MERGNRPANKANCHPIRNQNERAESEDDKRVQEEKRFRIGIIKEEERQLLKNSNVDEEISPSPIYATIGLCAICHLTLGIVNSEYNQHIPCSKEHALCQRCMERFANQSDAGCVLCNAQYRQSNMCSSRESNTSLNSVYIRSKRMQNSLQDQLEHCPNYHQYTQQSVPNNNAEQLYNKPWNQNYTSIVSNIEKNAFECYNTDQYEDDSDYGRNRYQNRSTCERNKDNVKQTQQYSYCNLLRKNNPDSNVSDAKVNGQITFDCSRRPIRCPRIDCAINVAFSALTHHFVFDHPEVPILNVEPGIKSTLIVSFNALSSNSSRCLALLLVSGKLPDHVGRLFNSGQINSKFRNRLPLPVLAARLHCTDQYVPSDKINKNNFHEKDVIIAWVAGLEIGNATDKLLCSIQAVDKIDSEGLRSLTYTGPVNSLRTAQCPQAIFSAGDCIILHEGLLSHITPDCATLNVNVTVH